MSKEIRIGMIGAGWMCGAHVSALSNAGKIYGEKIGTPMLKIVADTVEKAAEKAMKKYGFEKFSGDWKSVVLSDEVDLVDIVTPNAFHYEIARAALENGKHVYCEKPLSLTAEQSEELAELAEKKGLFNYVAYNNVMNPAVSYIKSLVESGALGDLVRFNGTYDQDMLLDPSIPISWRHKKAQAGCGALGDLGSHLLSVSQYVMGDIAKVVSQSQIFISQRPFTAGNVETGPVETEDVMTFMVQYASGALGQISTSRIATGKKNALTVEIQGTLGTVNFDLERLNEVNVYFHQDESVHRGFRNVLMGPEHGEFRMIQPASGINIGYNDMKIIEAAKVLAVLNEKQDYVCDFRFGAKIDATIQAALKSAESGRWESV